MKKTALIILALILVFSLFGCGKKEEPAYSVSEIAEKIAAETEFTDELWLLEGDAVANRYNIDQDKVSEYHILVGATGATAEEIAVFKLSSSSASADDMLDERIEDLTHNFADYRPDEMYKIENALRIQKGSYLIMVLAQDTEPARKAIEEMFK